MIVKYKVKFESPSSVWKKGTRPEVGERTVRSLAMAYYVDVKLENGEYRDYADAAASIGVSRSRLTQIMALLYLSPRIQEVILAGSLRVGEKRLRQVIRPADWQQQEVAARRF